jgi:hypothetical protein
VTGSPGRPVEVVLHAGSGKTGTSTIQAFCDRNRERLLAHGVLYPRTPGAVRHGRLGLSVRSDEELAASPHWARQPWADPAEFRREFRRDLTEEIRDAGAPTVLFSDEAFFAATSDPGLGRLRRLLDELAEGVRVVVYLRRQDDHLVSRYQQLVKTGEVRRLAAWAIDDFSRIYDYDATLRRLERLLAPATLVVRRFERGRFTDGSLLQDFLDAAGVPLRADDLQQVPARNESLDAESVEFLRLLNLHRVQTTDAEVGLVDNRRLVRRLVQMSSGPTLSLPETVLDHVMERWEQPNRAVARRCFGDEELFTEPRRTAGTTAEQRLDPSRLDRFLSLDGVPPRWHASLRRLAEEAAR